jgi:putative transcriptional regulator
MKLKNRLRVLRAEKELSQKDLADKVDLSRQTINSIERGKFNPSIITALKIAEYFSVPVDQVFTLEEDE